MRNLILIPLTLLCVNSYCQELSYKQFTVKDGLPGAVVYHALQDKNGFIWFATNQGVSRFDGRTFTNYLREDGLPDNEIIKLYLDSYNNIWFISLMGIPAVFYNGTIIRFDHCKGVTAICEDRLTDSIVLIAEQHKEHKEFKGYYRSRNIPGKWQFTAHFKASNGRALLNWPVVRASSAQRTSFYFSTVDEKHAAVRLKNDTATKHYLFKRISPREPAFEIHSFTSLTADQKGIVFYTLDSIYYCNFKKIYPAISLQKLKLLITKQDDLNSLFCENDSTLWICTRSQGLLCVKNFLTPHFTIRTFFTKSFCTAIIKDQENGYWVTTHGDGVFYLPNLSFYALSAYPDMATKNALCIRALDTSVIVAGFADGNILRINYASLSSKRFPQWATRNINNRVLDIWPLGQDTILAGTDRALAILARGKINNLGLNAVKAIYVQRDNTMLVGAAQGVSLRSINGGPQKALFSERTTCLAVLDGQYYWGTLHGVYTWSNNVVRYLGQKYPGLAGIINHLDVAPDAALWVSTQQGLAILKDTVITLIRKEQGLLSNICKHVSFDKNTAWVATDKGIVRIDYHWNKHRLYYSLSNITEEDGLTTNDVNQTIPVGNYIWAATARGISFFSKDYISRSVLCPLINISKVVAGGEVLPATDTVVLNRQKSKLLIELSGISYRSGRQIQYEYRLKELDSNWNSIANNSIEFPALPFGQFTFEVRTVDRWGKKSERPKSMIIINSPPFWKTNWFQLCAYLATTVLLGLGFYGFHRRRQQKREQEYQLKKKMHDLEMMALRAQMNPHFIFNCLSSIQYYIMRADVKNANTYLHKFSTLIRQTLQHSTSSVISLREEIRLLELYLELEKLRLGERMDYRVNVSNEVRQQDVFIPAMIIQPYVENAIKHGIAPLEDRKGILIIEITRHAGYIECFIEDNGPGMHAAMQDKAIDTSDYISMGTSITANRIHTINAIQKYKITLQVTDKQGSNHPASGTIVHLSFPIKND